MIIAINLYLNTMKHYLKILMYFLSICLLLASCKEAPTERFRTQSFAGPKGAKLDKLLSPYVEKLRKETDNEMGLAIGITEGSRIIYARTFGLANKEEGKWAHFETKFHIASLSKPFTSAALLKLIQDGKLELDDKLIKHIPEFRMQGVGYEKISLRHILTHTSGIPRHISQDDWLNPSFGPDALQENLEDVQNFELDFEPGSQYSYSNSAFDILGIVISRASGMPFSEYLQSQILEPAGMNASTYIKPENVMPKDWAKPYSYALESIAWKPYPHTEKYSPSSGLQTTLLDMCNWGRLHVGKGSYRDYQVLDEASFELMTSPHQDTPWGDKMGLGWFLQSYLDRPNLMHLGNDTGFEAAMYIYPEDSISIVVMANRDFSRVGRISLAAAEILFGQTPKSYSLSAKYPFAQTYKQEGLEAAKAKWEELRNDSTDIYQHDDEAILTAGAVLENAAEWEKALEMLEFYIELDENSTYAWRLLGNAHLGLGDTTAAISAYKKTQEINPDYEKGKQALVKLTGTK